MADMGEMEMQLPDNTIPMMPAGDRMDHWKWVACSRL